MRHEIKFHILFIWTSPSKVLNFSAVSYPLHILDTANNCRPPSLRLQPFIWERSVFHIHTSIYCICSATERYSHSLLYNSSHLFHCDVHFLLFPRCCCEGLCRWAYSYSRTAIYCFLLSFPEQFINVRVSKPLLTFK